MTCPSEIELARAITIEDATIRAHVASCPACTTSWAASIRTIDLARTVSVSMPDRDRREEMRTAILAASAGEDDDDARDDDARESRERVARRRRWYLASAAIAIAAGILLVVATRGTATHAHGTIVAHEGARYTTTHSPDEIVTLHDGTIDVSVAPLHAGERFRVVTADTEIEVRGTAFRVVAELGHVTSVVVEHGLVEVRPHDSAMVTLAAGQSWTAQVHTASSRTPVEPAPVEPAPIEPEIAPAPIEQIATNQQAPTRVSKAPMNTTSPGPAIASAPTSPVPRASAAPAIATSPPAPSIAPTAPRALDALAYDEGWSAMRGGDFEHAASAFARVSILEPDGALSEDASYWYAVALARAKRGEAISAFHDLLSRYPHSTHSGEANAMLGWLLVEAKRTAEAERRFRAAIDDPKPSVRESARSGLATLRR